MVCLRPRPHRISADVRLTKEPPRAPNKHRAARDALDANYAPKDQHGYYYTLEDTAKILNKSEDDIKRLSRMGSLESSLCVLRKRNFDFSACFQPARMLLLLWSSMSS